MSALALPQPRRIWHRWDPLLTKRAYNESTGKLVLTTNGRVATECTNCACSGWPGSAPSSLTATVNASTCSGVNGVSASIPSVTPSGGECLRWDGNITGFSCTGSTPVTNIRVIARVLTGGTEIEADFVWTAGNCTVIGPVTFSSPDSFACSPLSAVWNQGLFLLNDDTIFGTCNCCTGASGNVGFTLT